jgi:hypothetical protein
MTDIFLIIAIAALFAIALLYTGACESLKRPKGGR